MKKQDDTEASQFVFLFSLMLIAAQTDISDSNPWKAKKSLNGKHIFTE